jgi:hypothetical protein
VFNPDGANYTGLSAGASDISADPQVVSVSYGQIHLLATSPCIDAGQDSVVQSGWVDIVEAGASWGATSTSAQTSSTARHRRLPNHRSVCPSGDDLHDGSIGPMPADGAGGVGGSREGGRRRLGGRRHIFRAPHPQPWAFEYGGFAGTESERSTKLEHQPEHLGRRGIGDRGECAGRPSVSGLVGFWLQNRRNIIDGQTYGGGIYCRGSSPIIANNTITMCAAGHGGGISCEHSWPVISANTIRGNQGSGVYCVYGSPVIMNNQISGNVGDGIEASAYLRRS